MMNLKKGSQVKIISGKDKGKTGEILEIDRKLEKVKVKSINMIKKHLKPTKENKGGIISKESFIHQSNLKNVDLEKKMKDKKKYNIMKITPRLKAAYEKEIISKLMNKLSVKNKHEVPKIDKIILNMGLGEDASDGKKIKSCIDDMSLITGQKPIITKFKKSISNFKTRKGSSAGIKVTLRSYKMYEFIDRLINIALPRIKDFRGLSSKGLDNSFNYSFGIKEHIVFPEVNFDKVDKIRGLDITIVTTSRSKQGTLELLKEFNFPLNEKKN